MVVSRFEQRLGANELVNPLLECAETSGVHFKELRPFKKRIEDYISQQTNANVLTSAAVYFRDLQNGIWFGINERDRFVPASLLKVPLLLAYLKAAETQPDILSAEIVVPAETFSKRVADQNIKPESEIYPGAKYKVEDLLSRAIQFSDNMAAQILMSKNKSISVDKVLADLGIELTLAPEGKVHEITVKNYAALFRILYNASYLSHEMSNKALGILSASKFKDGIVAGVPINVVIAHKFGERVTTKGKQLHDCGIVYYSANPYLLCVMTRGYDLSELAKVIAEISRIAYESISNQVPEDKTKIPPP